MATRKTNTTNTEATTTTEETVAKTATRTARASKADKTAELLEKLEALVQKQSEQLEERDTKIQELEKKMEEMSKPTVVTLASDTEKVQLLWQAEVADDNVVTFGEGGMFGRIVGKTGTVFIPKNDLSRVLDAANRQLLDNRWLIVVSGLTDEEREALGVDYKEGEILDKKAFQRMVELGEEMLNIYPALCDSHKEMVEKRFYEAWTNKTLTASRELISSLNKLSKGTGFKKILEEMNEAELAK